MNVDPYWQEAHANRRWGVHPNEHMVRFVSRQFGTAIDRAKVKVLDLGCGAGSSALFLAHEGFDVLAVDGSKDAIEAMNVERKRRGIGGHSIATMVADLASFDMPLGFDCVVDICTLQHLPDSDARQVISRAKSWLRSRGWFFSIMAAPGWDIAGSHKPRIVDREWFDGVPTTAFDGYKVDLGHERVVRPGSAGIACHWIVQAQKER